MEKLAQGAKALGLSLTSEQLQTFETYWAEIAVWNERLNLTAVTELGEAQTRHFLDSLTVLLAFPRARDSIASCDDHLTVLDVGAGAGFPGLPLRIACPNLTLTLLEATKKKVAFLRHVIKALGMDPSSRGAGQAVMVVEGRAEEVAHLSQYRESFDIVVARAVARLSSLAELCLPFNRVGGRFIAMKGADVSEEVEEARGAFSALGGSLLEVRQVELPDVLPSRSLVVVSKVQPTPQKYPRRPGIPVKRPL